MKRIILIANKNGDNINKINKLKQRSKAGFMIFSYISGYYLNFFPKSKTNLKTQIKKGDRFQKDFVYLGLFRKEMRFKILLLLIGAIFFVRCTSYKNIVYFNDLGDSIPSNLSKAEITFENPIQVNDILNIRISTLSSQDALILNPTQTATSGQNNIGITGYLVDKNGEIKIPVVGSVKVAGLTRHELESLLSEKLKDFSKDPVVTVRYLDSKVTILGEVNHPGIFKPETERFTILDALGDAGDLKVTAKRNNILVIREVNGQRRLARLDLTKKNILNSPYFYLKSKDVIYVEPVKASYATRNDFFSPYVGIGASLLSILISVILLTRK